MSNSERITYEMLSKELLRELEELEEGVRRGPKQTLIILLEALLMIIDATSDQDRVIGALITAIKEGVQGVEIDLSGMEDSARLQLIGGLSALICGVCGSMDVTQTSEGKLCAKCHRVEL